MYGSIRRLPCTALRESKMCFIKGTGKVTEQYTENKRHLSARIGLGVLLYGVTGTLEMALKWNYEVY